MFVCVLLLLLLLSQKVTGAWCYLVSFSQQPALERFLLGITYIGAFQAIYLFFPDEYLQSPAFQVTPEPTPLVLQGLQCWCSLRRCLILLLPNNLTTYIAVFCVFDMKKSETEWLLAFWNKIQTQKASEERLFVMTQTRNMQIHILLNLLLFGFWHAFQILTICFFCFLFLLFYLCCYCTKFLHVRVSIIEHKFGKFQSLWAGRLCSADAVAVAGGGSVRQDKTHVFGIVTEDFL